MNQIIIAWDVWIDQGVVVGGNHYALFWYPDQPSSDTGSLMSDENPLKVIAWAEKYLQAKTWTVTDDPYYCGKHRYESMVNVDILRWTKAGCPIVKVRK